MGVTEIKQFRNEWKYCCSESILTIIENRLKQILDIDKNSDSNGKYEIHSLYFDNILPSYIRHLVTNHEIVQTPFSKYYFGRCQIQRNEGL